MNLNKQVYFISGIDTDAGKSYATAMLAKLCSQNKKSVITQKFIQTGQDPALISEDIITHRRLQGIELLQEDHNKTTCPIIFRLPASPHLAAKEENTIINIEIIKAATEKLIEKYDIVLIEGAGGLTVPVGQNYLTADYIVENNLPLILVATAKLGSLNHTLLSLEYCKNRHIDIAAVVYNTHISTNKTITNDTAEFIKQHLAQNFPQAKFIEMTTIL